MEGDTHKLEQALDLALVLLGDADLPPCLSVNILGGSCDCVRCHMGIFSISESTQCATARILRDAPVSLASSSSSFASCRFSNRLASCRAQVGQECKAVALSAQRDGPAFKVSRADLQTHNSALELRRLAVENVDRLDTVLNHTDSPTAARRGALQYAFWAESVPSLPASRRARAWLTRRSPSGGYECA